MMGCTPRTNAATTCMSTSGICIWTAKKSQEFSSLAWLATREEMMRKEWRSWRNTHGNKTIGLLICSTWTLEKIWRMPRVLLINQRRQMMPLKMMMVQHLVMALKASEHPKDAWMLKVQNLWLGLILDTHVFTTTKAFQYRGKNNAQPIRAIIYRSICSIKMADSHSIRLHSIHLRLIIIEIEASWTHNQHSTPEKISGSIQRKRKCSKHNKLLELVKKPRKRISHSINCWRNLVTYRMTDFLKRNALDPGISRNQKIKVYLIQIAVMVIELNYSFIF